MFAVIDWDNTARDQLLAVRRFRLGEIQKETFDNLGRLLTHGSDFCIYTNQFEKGHQIARLLAGRLHYDFFPDSLVKVIGQKRLLGVSGYIPKNKRSERRIGELAQLIGRRCEEMEVDQVGVFDDREIGYIVAEKLARVLPHLDYSFYKLPDPVYEKVVPRRLRKFTNVLVP
jgi:hypothetical protein